MGFNSGFKGLNVFVVIRFVFRAENGFVLIILGLMMCDVYKKVIAVTQ